MLKEYSWPGNVRELENVIERAVVMCTDPSIDADHLTLERPRASAKPATLNDIEREAILHSRNIIRNDTCNRFAVAFMQDENVARHLSRFAHVRFEQAREHPARLLRHADYPIVTVQALAHYALELVDLLGYLPNFPDPTLVVPPAQGAGGPGTPPNCAPARPPNAAPAKVPTGW